MRRTYALNIVVLLCAGILLVACGGSDEDELVTPMSESDDQDSTDMSHLDTGYDSGTSADTGHYETDSGDNGGASDTDAGYDTGEDPWTTDQDQQAANNEKFEDVGTNPFVDVSHDPFSTFAADVDSASYDIFRRDVNLGTLPNPASVRLEEYVNSFTYDYPAPSPEAEHPFEITLAGSPDLFGNGTKLLRVAIQGELPPPSQKKPANLVFLIDTSGSMSGSDKLPLIQYLLNRVVEVLDPGDTVSIVTYAGSTRVALEPTKVEERQTITSAINSFSAGGSTAGASGINLAYEQAQAGFIEGGINHVILCTDGDFNVGPSSNEELLSLIEDKRKTGVTLTVLGFGTGNLNDSMMEAVSNAGNGVYGVISSQKQAADYAENKILANINYIAKDVKIQVEFNPNHVKAYRLLGYENRAVADEDFRNDTVDGGEIGAGHRVTALYEIVLDGDSVPEREDAPGLVTGEPVVGERQVAESDLVLIKVRYKEVDASETDPAFEVQKSLTVGTIAENLNGMDHDFKWAVAIAAYAEILKSSPFANQDALTDIGAIVHEATWTDPARAEFVELFDKALDLF